VTAFWAAPLGTPPDGEGWQPLGTADLGTWRDPALAPPLVSCSGCTPDDPCEACSMLASPWPGWRPGVSVRAEIVMTSGEVRSFTRRWRQAIGEPVGIERRLVRLAIWRRHDCRCGCRWRRLGRRHTRTCGWCS
jgi:hypothetical protein